MVWVGMGKKSDQELVGNVGRGSGWGEGEVAQLLASSGQGRERQC